MTLPGVEVITSDEPAATGPRLQLSTVFVVGETERGPLTPDAAKPLRNTRGLAATYGARTPDTMAVWDWLDAYWREGGGRAYVAPLVGPAAAAATTDLLDGAAAVAMTATAKDIGAFGNRLAIDVAVSGSNFEAKVFLDGVQVETTGLVADTTAAAAWSIGSTYVTLTAGPGTDPAATGTPQALTGGDSDLDGVTVDDVVTAYRRLDSTLGPGVVVLPGRTATATILAVADVAAPDNRLTRADFPPVSDSAAIIAALAALRSGTDNDDVIDPVGPRLTIPGIAPGTSRTVEASVLRCAAEARNDAAGVSPNQPAAGVFGAAKYATGVTVEWDADAREAINDAGGNVARVIDGQVRMYGSRTLSDPATDPAGVYLGSARLRMAIREIARYRGEQIAFAEIDQGGVALGNHVGLVRGDIQQYAGSLYQLDVTADVEQDPDQPGVYIVATEIVFQAAPNAERVRVTITRQVTEV